MKLFLILITLILVSCDPKEKTATQSNLAPEDCETKAEKKIEIKENEVILGNPSTGCSLDEAKAP